VPTNFLLASSAIIPLLALTLLVELRTYDARPGGTDRKSALASFGAIVLLTANGEWICLRSLQVGRLVTGFPFPGVSGVWAAILLLSIAIVSVVGLRIVGRVPGQRVSRKAEDSYDGPQNLT